MIDALIGGTLHGAPKSRTSQNGNPYATAVVRTPCRDGSVIFVNVIAFSRTACAALAALSEGDSVAIAGELTPKVYAPPSGEPRPSVDLLAHAVLTEYHVAKKRKALEPAKAREADGGGAPFDDELPAREVQQR